MIVGYCVGGTGCYGNTCSCAGGNSEDSVVIWYSSTPTSSNVKAADPAEKLALAKDEVRALNRVNTLWAQNDLAWFHDREQISDGHPRMIHHRRPGRRRTCTAIRNFRGRP